MIDLSSSCRHRIFQLECMLCCGSAGGCRGGEGEERCDGCRRPQQPARPAARSRHDYSAVEVLPWYAQRGYSPGNLLGLLAICIYPVLRHPAPASPPEHQARPYLQAGSISLSKLRIFLPIMRRAPSAGLCCALTIALNLCSRQGGV